MPTKSPSKTITRDPNWLGPVIPPGEILLEEYFKPLGVGQVEAARRLGISLNRLNEIVLGKRGITADTALRLSRFLKTSPHMWMHLQADWDLQQAVRRAARKGIVGNLFFTVPVLYLILRFRAILVIRAIENGRKLLM
jgi:addiction module HigA family antidote